MGVFADEASSVDVEEEPFPEIDNDRFVGKVLGPEPIVLVRPVVFPANPILKPIRVGVVAFHEEIFVDGDSANIDDSFDQEDRCGGSGRFCSFFFGRALGFALGE